MRAFKTERETAVSETQNVKLEIDMRTKYTSSVKRRNKRN